MLDKCDFKCLDSRDSELTAWGTILLAVFGGKDGFPVVHLEGFFLKSQGQRPVQHSDRRASAARRLPHNDSEHQACGDGRAMEITPEQTLSSLNGGGGVPEGQHLKS